MIYVVLGIFSLGFVLNLCIWKKIYHPNVIFSAVWIIQILGLIIFDEYFFETKLPALFLLTLGFLSFNLGVIIGTYAHNKPLLQSTNREVNIGSKSFVVAALFCVLCGYEQYRIFSTFSVGDLSERLIILRSAISMDGDDVYGIYKYGSPIALVIVALLWAEFGFGKNSFTRRVLFITFLIINLGFGFMSTGRGSILVVLFVIFLIYALQQVKQGRFLRALAGFFLIIVFVYFVFSLLGQLTGKANDKFSENFSGLINQQFSSVPAFSAYIDSAGFNSSADNFGEGTFRFFYAGLKSLGFDVPVKSNVQDFVNIPEPTNIYTWYHLYVSDFGWAGMIIFPFLVGIGSGVVYAVSKTLDSSYRLVLMAVVYLPIIFSSGSEGYFSAASRWIILFGALWFTTKRVLVSRLDGARV